MPEWVLIPLVALAVASPTLFCLWTGGAFGMARRAWQRRRDARPSLWPRVEVTPEGERRFLP